MRIARAGSTPYLVVVWNLVPENQPAHDDNDHDGHDDAADDDIDNDDVDDDDG